MIRVAYVKYFNTDNEIVIKGVDYSDSSFIRLPILSEIIVDETLDEFRVVEIKHYLNSSDMRLHITAEFIPED